MFSNYLKIAFRNLLRHKEYSIINIAGLALGIACCIVILLLARHELTFDRFHANADRICRVYTKLSSVGWTNIMGNIQGPLGPALEADFPEVSGYTRFLNSDWPPRIRVLYKDKVVYIDNTYYTDPSIFQVFSFELIEGDAATALVEPYTAVLTEEAARKIFGDEEPLGKIFQRDGKNDYKVTGVLKKIPRNSHLQFDMLLSMTELVNQPQSQIHKWGIFNPYCYILLEPGTDIKRLEAGIRAYLKKYPETNNFEFYLQPLLDVHLRSTQVQSELNWAESDTAYVYGISLLALIVLLIACFNFMNLSTARFAGRAREVGIRKVVGAQRGQLIGQFLGESVLLSFFALLVAVALIELALPALNAFFDGVLVFNYLHDWHLVAGFVALVICVGFIAGSYPAFFLSAFRPVNVLKSTPSYGGTRGAALRKTLVTIQFAASIILLVSTCVVVRQIQYIRHKNLGYNGDYVITVPMDNEIIRRSFNTIRQELLQNPAITGVTASLVEIGRREGFPFSTCRFEGDGKSDKVKINYLPVDPEFFSFYSLHIVDGRAYSPAMTTDLEGTSGSIINETLARKLGWNSVAGKRCSMGRGSGDMFPVIGIVKDFNFRSLHYEIEPLVIYIGQGEEMRKMSIRIRPENISQTLVFIKNKLSPYTPDRPFEYSFLNDSIAASYRTEQRVAKVIGAFALLAVFVACLGLLGLISYAAEKRTKEIGIRKILGASVSDIILLLSREYLLLLGFSVLIAWPVAWYLMNKWLQNFAYRIDLDWMTFLLGGVIALAIAALTVGYQAVKAATANPIDALRYE